MNKRGAGFNLRRPRAPIEIGAQDESCPTLRRELGVRDLTLFAIACIVSVRWPAVAAHAGPSSITLWVLTAIFFVVPLAIAVAALCAKYPGAGGLYLWTRNDFGPWHGFLAFWVYWIANSILLPSVAMFYMSVAAYTLGLANSRVFVITGSLVVIWVALGTNVIGLKVGKWTTNLGGAATWVLGALLVAAAILVRAKRGMATSITMDALLPRWQWATVNFWATIAFGLSGMELAGLMDGEIKNPNRTLPRAAAIASAFAALFYVGATASMLALARPADIDELRGLGQAGTIAASVIGAPWIPGLIAALVLATSIGYFGGLGSATARLPFAVGVDRLLPEAFGRIHPRWQTPHISILFLGVSASLILIAIQIGDSMRAAYETLISLMALSGFLPYLYIFGSAWKAKKRLSAVSGWVVTVIALVTAVSPAADVTDVWLFESKLAVGTIAMIASAWLVYRRSKG